MSPSDLRPRSLILGSYSNLLELRIHRNQYQDLPLYNSLGPNSSTHFLQIHCIGPLGPRLHTFRLGPQIVSLQLLSGVVVCLCVRTPFCLPCVCVCLFLQTKKSSFFFLIFFIDKLINDKN